MYVREVGQMSCLFKTEVSTRDFPETVIKIKHIIKIDIVTYLVINS